MAIAITGITPATAPTTGGTVHYVTGTDLDDVTGVTIGGAAVTALGLLRGVPVREALASGVAVAVAAVPTPTAGRRAKVYSRAKVRV